jgi:hypothetical protein
VDYKRLMPNEAMDFGLYPMVMRRVAAYLAENCPKVDIDAVMYEMVNRWTSTPGHTCYIAVLDGLRVVGHMIRRAMGTWPQRQNTPGLQGKSYRGYALRHHAGIPCVGALFQIQRPSG